ncbi:hypothetical protein [Streptomyces sp. NPDC029003]|uniref:hypothetical protein n=1 Tax=Streptomyces sp. NPDC029003 TaxID=3155125 RepID=UPI003407DF67
MLLVSIGGVHIGGAGGEGEGIPRDSLGGLAFEQSGQGRSAREGVVHVGLLGGGGYRAGMGEAFLAEDGDHDACGVCPSLRMPRESFVVYDRPSRECPFDPADGYRYTADRTPACVHPGRIGVTPDRIAPPPEKFKFEEPAPRRRWWARG